MRQGVRKGLHDMISASSLMWEARKPGSRPGSAPGSLNPILLASIGWTSGAPVILARLSPELSQTGDSQIFSTIDVSRQINHGQNHDISYNLQSVILLSLLMSHNHFPNSTHPNPLQSIVLPDPESPKPTKPQLIHSHHIRLSASQSHQSVNFRDTAPRFGVFAVPYNS